MSSITASRRDVPLGFGEVGDLLGDMLHRSTTVRVCAFCRTARHRAGPCAVCGTRREPATDPLRNEAVPHRTAGPTARGSEGPVVARLLGQVLLLPLLLFAGFGTWYADYRSDKASTRVVQAGPAVAVPANVAAHAAGAATGWKPAEPDARQASNAMSASSAAATTAASAEPPALDGPVRAAYMPKGRGGEPMPRGTNKADAMDARSTNSLAACGGKNFFLRAVCVNDFCAQPAHRQLSQCAEAIAQRRIDERRRDGGIFLN